jgi:hypothetical protein
MASTAFLTDLAYVDDRGYIRISGRSKDVVIRGGENIPVVEIEALLYRHPAISQVAIVAYPDGRLGERACAVVVPKLGGHVELPALVQFLKTPATSQAHDVDNRIGKGFRRLLRQIVADPARHLPVEILPGELVDIRLRLGMGGAVGIPLERDGRNGNRGRSREAVLERIELCFSLGDTEPPAVVVDDDGRMVGVQKRLR